MSTVLIKFGLTRHNPSKLVWNAILRAVGCVWIPSAMIPKYNYTWHQMP